MKRQLLFAGLFAVCLGTREPLRGQDAAAIAAREEAETRYKRISSRVQEIEETLQAHQKTIMRLTEELHRLNEEVSRLGTKNENAATLESLKQLGDKIEEVDKKRQADNDLVLAQLKALGKAALQKASVPATANPVPAPGKGPGTAPGNKEPGPGPGPNASVPETGYEYTIKSGDTLDKILRDLRAHGMKLTQKQAMDANPGVNWNRLQIGQKIFIPAPQ